MIEIEVRWSAKVKMIERVGPVAADQFLVIRRRSGIVGKSGPRAAAR